MNIRELKFMQELDKALGSHPEKENVIAEYEAHIYEVLREEHSVVMEGGSEVPMTAAIDAEEEPTSVIAREDENACYERLCQRLGNPSEIAAMWKNELQASARKMQWLFVVCNIALFAGGILLTVSYNLFDWHWVQRLWTALTDAAFLIMLTYIAFWGLLGYEIGKEFGHRGSRVLRKTFLLTIVPNLVLMYLTVFKFYPHDWFQPLLSAPFIVVCMVLTALLYPISWLGFRWGKKVSL